MVHCSAKHEAMKDTGRWVGSRWSRVKHSGITEFFYNNTNLPSVRAFAPAPPPTYFPSPSLCTCSDSDSPSHLDTWDVVNRRMDTNQMFCFYWSHDSNEMRNVSLCLLSPSSCLLPYVFSIFWWLNVNMNRFAIAIAKAYCSVCSPSPISPSLSLLLSFPVIVKANDMLKHSGQCAVEVEQGL